MGQGIISRSNPGNSGSKVGDIRITMRNTLGDKWALCNGESIPADSDYRTKFGDVDPMNSAYWGTAKAYSGNVDPTAYPCAVTYAGNGIYYYVSAYYYEADAGIDGLKLIIDQHDIYSNATSSIYNEFISNEIEVGSCQSIYCQYANNILSICILDNDSTPIIIDCDISQDLQITFSSDPSMLYGVFRRIHSVAYANRDWFFYGIYTDDIDEEYYTLIDMNKRELFSDSFPYHVNATEYNGDTYVFLSDPSSNSLYTSVYRYINGHWNNVAGFDCSYMDGNIIGAYKIDDDKYIIASAPSEGGCAAWAIYNFSTTSAGNHISVGFNGANTWPVNSFVYNDSIYIYDDNGEIFSYDLNGNYDIHSPLTAIYNSVVPRCQDTLYETNYMPCSNIDSGWHCLCGSDPSLPTISVDDESYCFIKIKD